MIDLKNKKILITGAHGFLGSHLMRFLHEGRGVSDTQIFAPTMDELDLRRGEDCEKAVEGRDVVLHLAAKVGGIGLNQAKPGELFYDNIMMGVQLMEEARKAGVQKFVGLATICAYPKFTPAPFREDTIWDGYPEETNAPYGLAKKMLLVQAQAYRAQYGMDAVTLFPVNMYGPGDNFDLETSHVIPALIRKVAEAKHEGRPFIEAWGTGAATREFLYVKDGARGIVMAAEAYDKSEPVNIGSGQEISIKDLIALICEMMDYQGEVRWNSSKPDGQPRRLLDTSRATKEFGFTAETPLREGLKETIEWYLTQR